MNDLPEGFVLENQNAGLPDGFVLEPSQGKSFGQAVQSVWDNPPSGPSLIGMAKSLWSGATLPGDVVTGKVDPQSQEARERALNLAGGVALGGTAAPAGALGSGLVRPNIQSAVKKVGVPTAEELKAVGGEGFNAMRQEGLEVKPSVITDFATQVRSKLENDLGLDEILAPKTLGVLQKAAASPEGSVATAANIHSLRRKLGTLAGNADKDEAKAAYVAKNELDQLIENMPPEGVLSGDPNRVASLLKTANANYAAGERASAIDAKLINAERRAGATHSGQNIANTIRQRMATVASEPKYMRGYNPAEKAMVNSIANGTLATNSTRYFGKLLGGGGGLGQFATGAVAGHALGGPLGLAAPLAGIALTKASNALTRAQAKALSEMLRSRAPEAVRRQAAAAIAATLAPAERPAGLLGFANANPQGLLSLLAGPQPASNYQ